MVILNFFPTIFPKKTGTNLEWPKMAVLNFFLTIFPKKTGINSERPKMCILNLFKHFWYKKKLEQEICNGQKWAF